MTGEEPSWFDQVTVGPELFNVLGQGFGIGENEYPQVVTDYLDSL
jgi:hypothetical protein